MFGFWYRYRCPESTLGIRLALCPVSRCAPNSDACEKLEWSSYDLCVHHCYTKALMPGVMLARLMELHSRESSSNAWFRLTSVGTKPMLRPDIITCILSCALAATIAFAIPACQALNLIYAITRSSTEPDSRMKFRAPSFRPTDQFRRIELSRNFETLIFDMRQEIV